MIKIPNGIFCNHQGRSSLNTGIDFSGTEELEIPAYHYSGLGRSSSNNDLEHSPFNRFY